MSLHFVPQNQPGDVSLDRVTITPPFSVDEHISLHIRTLQRLEGPKGYGYDPISQSDGKLYLFRAEEFDFGFSKQNGIVVYSLEQVEARRSFFNDLPQDMRVHLCRQKLEALDLNRQLDEFLPFHQSTISDVQDIGMSHSVYLISCTSPEGDIHRVVLKKEEHPNQQFFTGLLSELGWPSFRSRHLQNASGAFEIYDYTEGRNVNEVLLTPEASTVLLPQLTRELARQAALGDFLGLGDRHMENKILHQQKIIPIDINYLFMENNTEWTPKYCESGMYEVALLAKVTASDSLLEATARYFFSEYRKTMQELANATPRIQNHIAAFPLWSDDERNANTVFVGKQYASVDALTENHIELMVDAIQHLQERHLYRGLLRDLHCHLPAIVESDPVMRMYYYADLDRSSCFYLYELWNPRLLDLIHQYAMQYLSIEASYFDNEFKRIERQQKIVAEVALK